MKKYIILLASIFTLCMVGVVGIALTNSNNAQAYFASSGYVLGETTADKVTFTEQTAYKASATGTVQFKSETGDATVLSSDTFVHLDGGSVMALSAGVLLDFADLSSNFINNYYTTSGFSITESGSGYVAQTESGELTFGEHLWKLSDDKYIIRSTSLTVHFSEEDAYTVSDYVEVSITTDGIVRILTEDETWATISEQCYIETAGGVKINPVTKIIDDGTYQITINKLVVSPDDSIVLTEDETRRQIVPEITIEAIDGADGESGASGENGEDGDTGVSGEDGESGEAGDSGDSGDGGGSGTNGAKGVDSTVSSSTNTALPTMTIGDWNVTSTSLQATIIVGGGTEALNTTEVASTSSKDYYGSITITNAVTGEVVLCYQVDDIVNGTYMEPSDSDDYNIDFTNEVDVYFSTAEFSNDTYVDMNTLTPDTQYILSVNAYYVIDDVVYYREFISRTFYTDSTGVQVSALTSTTTTATVSVSRSTSESEVTLYLLTPEQNESFSLAATNVASNYTAKLEGVFTADALSASATFSGLTSDTEYIVRAVVTTDGNSTLTSQEETVQTLKTPLVGVGDNDPTAFYDRVGGALQVYLPSGITDADDGITKYVYTVYNDDDEFVTTKTLSVSDVQPATFYLNSGDAYYVTVEAYFDDNEKETIYNLGDTNTVTIEGTTLPKVSWASYVVEDDVTVDSGVEYNAVEGVIRIDLSNGASIVNGSLITVAVYADQVIDAKISLDSTNGYEDINEAEFYEVTCDLSNSSNTNYIDIYVYFTQLYNNTNYSFTISADVDLGDGNGAVYRTLGYVTATTYKTNTLSVTWGTNDAYSSSLRTTMSLTSNEDGGSTNAYTETELVNGEVTVKLYSGTGNVKTVIATATYSNPDDLLAIYSDDGITITEDTFNLQSLDTSQDYTLEVTRVVDATASEGLGYENTFTLVNATKSIVASASPPALLTDPTAGVTATAITNIEATLYGATYDETIPDDTIIGYRLQANYDNTQLLAKSVTYYLFDYADFYYGVTNGEDVVKEIIDGTDNSSIDAITLSVSSGSTTLPSLAVFFTSVSFSSNTATDATVTYNGSYVYSVSEANGSNSNKEFERGYRYLFAYTAEYNTNAAATGDNSIYPYDYNSTATESYASYTTRYGCGSEMGTSIGLGIAYILNSGMVSVPKSAPEFSSYVYSTTSSSADGMSGTVLLYYTFTDIDGAILTNAGYETEICFANDQGNDETVAINASPVNGATGWYSISLPYSFSATSSTVVTETLLQPTVLVDDYIYDYSLIIEALTGSKTAADITYYLAQIPVEIDYGTLFNTAAYQDAVKITVDPQLNENYIKFTLSNNAFGSTTAFDSIMDRAYALKLTFTSKDGDTLVFYPTISYVLEEYTVTFSTSQISSFLEKDFTITAEVCYDTGTQGWSLLDTELFGLQLISTTEGDETTFGFSSYYTASSTATTLTQSRSGGLITYNFSNYTSYSAFDAALRATSTGEDLLTTTFWFAAYENRSLTRYLSVQNYGVNFASQNDVTKVGTDYIVPKGVGNYTTLFALSNNTTSTTSDTLTLSSITPSVGDITRSTSVNAVYVSNFTVSGYTQIKADTNGDYYVTLSVYDNAQADGTAVNSTMVKLGSDGKPAESGTITINDLDPATTYYLVFSATLSTGETILLDTDTAAQAIYTFKTVDGLEIDNSDSEGVLYYNTGYTAKSLSYTYDLNEYKDVTATYNVYAAADVVDGKLVSGATPVLTYDKMVDSKILLTSSLYYYNNSITVILEPSKNRDALNPGESYYLEVYVYTGEDESLVSDVLYEPFTIRAATTPTAYITADNATSDSITFKVSIADAEYSLMTYDGTTPYVVRFTDQNGNLIQTTYDETVYNANEAQKTFVLSQSNLTGTSSATQAAYVQYTEWIESDAYTAWYNAYPDEVKAYNEWVESGASASTKPSFSTTVYAHVTPVLAPETNYTINIYGLIDAEHNGYSYPIASANGTTLDTSTKQLTSYFYAGTPEWKTFSDLVDSFWVQVNTETTTTNDNIASMDVVEANFLFANKTQKTTNEDNFYLSTQDATVSYNSTMSMFSLVLSESYGIVVYDEDTDTYIQAFERIEYQMTGASSATSGGLAYYGNSYYTTDTLFVQGTDSVGDSVYTYQIPDPVESGKYYISIYLYDNIDDEMYTEELYFTAYTS